MRGRQNADLAGDTQGGKTDAVTTDKEMTALIILTDTPKANQGND